MSSALLLVDADDDRRRVVSEGAAERGYETVPVADLASAQRFAEAVDPRVVIMASGLGPPEELVEHFGAPERTLLFLVEEAEAMPDLPDEVFALPIAGLPTEELVRRLQLVLVGQELGVQPDLELRSLVGDLSLLSMLELVRELHRLRASGRVSVPGGEVVMAEGKVVRARLGKAKSEKAFCRLGLLHDGPFHVTLEPVGGPREIETSLDDLVLQAVEDAQLTFPDPRLRIRILGVDESAPPDSGRYQRQMLQAISHCSTLGEFFDALPGPDGTLYKAAQRMVTQGIIALEKPRTAVQVVTDSTADLPQDLVRSHGIVVVPLSILFGKDTFRDGVDIQPRDFYELLESSEDHPSTAPPTEGEFYEHFHDLVVEQDILGIHISSKLSQTLAHARGAALRGSRGFDHLPKERHNFALELIDSQNVSMATGLLALFAARMARRGYSLGPINHMIQGLIPRIEILFVVNTLDYLLKGGRIGKARALVGKLFGIKPILSVVDGEVTNIDRVRGGRQAQKRIVEILSERLDLTQPVVAAVAHARAPVWGDRLRSLVEKTFKLREGIVTDIGPVVGTHAGPGCVGCVAVQPTPEEWELIRPLEE